MAKKGAGNWKKELARDFIALGSWVFYALVIIRLINHRPYVYEFVFSLAFLLLITIFIRKYEGYIARALILSILTIIFYNDPYFSIFTPIVFVGLVASSGYLENDWKKIGLGILVGAISAALGYYLTYLIF